MTDTTRLRRAIEPILGWWRIRAKLRYQPLDPKPLEVLGQMTRTGPVEAFGPTR